MATHWRRRSFHPGCCIATVFLLDIIDSKSLHGPVRELHQDNKISNQIILLIRAASVYDYNMPGPIRPLTTFPAMISRFHCPKSLSASFPTSFSNWFRASLASSHFFARPSVSVVSCAQARFFSDSMNLRRRVADDSASWKLSISFRVGGKMLSLIYSTSMSWFRGCLTHVPL
jgi:hypothetical protein